MRKFVIFVAVCVQLSCASAQQCNVSGQKKVATCRYVTMQNDIRRIVSGRKAVIGVAIYNCKNEESFCINGCKRFPMQSVFKLPIVLKLLSKIDAGEESLSDSIFIKDSDLLPETWSPMREKYVHGNVNVALSDIIRYTIAQSDNNGCDILLRHIGGPSVVNEYLRSIGIEQITIARNEAEQHTNFNSQYDNWATPMETVKLLKLLYEKRLLKENSHEFLWKTMCETSTGSVKDKIPQTVSVAHKTGSGFDPKVKLYVTNDVGVMVLPDNTAALFAIYIMKSKENRSTNYEIIADIAKCVHRYLSCDEKGKMVSLNNQMK